MATDIKDNIFIDIGFLKDKIILMDINNIEVMNRDFKYSTRYIQMLIFSKCT